MESHRNRYKVHFCFYCNYYFYYNCIQSSTSTDIKSNFFLNLAVVGSKKAFVGKEYIYIYIYIHFTYKIYK